MEHLWWYSKWPKWNIVCYSNCITIIFTETVENFNSQPFLYVLNTQIILHCLSPQATSYTRILHHRGSKLRIQCWGTGRYSYASCQSWRKRSWHKPWGHSTDSKLTCKITLGEYQTFNTIKVFPSTCDFENMGRCSANHHKPQGFFSTYVKSWWLYRWNRFKQRTDKWGLLQWYLVILGIIACVLFSSLYQSRVMDLDRTNRVFYKKIIMDEKRKKDYQELDSLIHSDSFFKTYWGLNN